MLAARSRANTGGAMSAKPQSESGKLLARSVELYRNASGFLGLVKGWIENWEKYTRWGKTAKKVEIKNESDKKKDEIKRTSIELEELDGDEENYGKEKILYDQEWVEKDKYIKREWQAISDRIDQRNRENVIDEIAKEKEYARIKDEVDQHARDKNAHDEFRTKRIHTRRELDQQYDEFARRLANW
jgi:hypothetical protein